MCKYVLFLFQSHHSRTVFAGLSCLKSPEIDEHVLLFLLISSVQVILFSKRLCEVVWGCIAPWEYLPLTLHGCLAYIPKDKSLKKF